MQITKSYGLKPEFAVMTMHRPSNVDEPIGLQTMLELIQELCKRLPLVFPVHPRTRKNLERFQLWDQLNANSNLFITEPLAYLGL